MGHNWTTHIRRLFLSLPAEICLWADWYHQSNTEGKSDAILPHSHEQCVPHWIYLQLVNNFPFCCGQFRVAHRSHCAFSHVFPQFYLQIKIIKTEKQWRLAKDQPTTKGSAFLSVRQRSKTFKSRELADFSVSVSSVDFEWLLFHRWRNLYPQKLTKCCQSCLLAPT